MARERPSANRLRRFAEEHLLYEAAMLHEVTGKLMNRHHEDDPVVQNALLQSFGVHNRNLIDFLWLDRPMKDTDAIARDWTEGWQAPEMSERLANVKDRVRGFPTKLVDFVVGAGEEGAKDCASGLWKGLLADLVALAIKPEVTRARGPIAAVAGCIVESAFG